MPQFRYVARNRKGERAEGRLDAPDRRAAQLQLERQGLIPVSVAEAVASAEAARPARRPGAARPRGGSRKRMTTRDVLTFTTEMSDLLAAGMTLGNTLNTLARRTGGGATERIIAELRDQIVQGSSLSDALARHPRSFSTLYVSMVKAGEASGALSEVLTRLVQHYERMQDVKEKVAMALIYPSIVVLMGVLTIVFSMIFVIPKFQTIFDSLGSQLPLPTKILIFLSRSTVRYGWAILIGIAAGLAMANRAVKTERGALWWHGLKLKIPLVRNVIAAGIFANFARTLSTLLSNGVPVLQALGIVEKTVNNAVIARELSNAKSRVTDGTTISGPLAAGRVFPPIMTEMLAIGEQTGDMAGALTHIAQRYENELNRSVKIFTTALEPILIVAVALLVGFVAISILMAVFNLTSGLNV